jgi:hypothetical protein
MPNDACQPIREDIAAIQAEILSLQDLLSEVPASLKPTVQANIKREKDHLARMKRALKACQQAMRGA